MKPIGMIHASVASAILALGLASAPAADATVLISEDFSSATIINGVNVTTTTNLNQWVDSATDKWTITSGGICANPCTGSFAQHLEQASDNTNLLFYGVNAVSLAAGTNLNFSFDYIVDPANALSRGTAYLVGLTGTQLVSPFAPWFNDATIIDQWILTAGGGWTSASFDAILGQGYDALVIGFAFGGTAGSRGVDNVSLSVVPVPGTVALLGLGLFALARTGRRRH